MSTEILDVRGRRKGDWEAGGVFFLTDNINCSSLVSIASNNGTIPFTVVLWGRINKNHKNEGGKFYQYGKE